MHLLYEVAYNALIDTTVRKMRAPYCQSLIKTVPLSTVYNHSLAIDGRSYCVYNLWATKHSPLTLLVCTLTPFTHKTQHNNKLNTVIVALGFHLTPIMVAVLLRRCSTMAIALVDRGNPKLCVCFIIRSDLHRLSFVSILILIKEH